MTLCTGCFIRRRVVMSRPLNYTAACVQVLERIQSFCTRRRWTLPICERLRYAGGVLVVNLYGSRWSRHARGPEESRCAPVTVCIYEWSPRWRLEATS